MNVRTRASHQGGSIVLVLLVSSVLLLFVLALGTLSSLNINIVRSQVEYNQALLTAQAAAAQMLYDLENYEWNNSAGVELASSSSPSMDLKKRFGEMPVFIPANPCGGENVSIAFDHERPFYSTDNSQSDIPARGWNDRTGATASVPPFSIDLIITTTVGGSTRHFQAIINKTWPYVALCARAPITVTSRAPLRAGDPASSFSLVKGNLLSLYKPPGASLASDMDAAPSDMPPDCEEFYRPVDTSNLPGAAIIIGGKFPGDTGNMVIGNARTAVRNPRLAGSGPESIFVSPGNVLMGHKVYGVPSRIMEWGRNPLSYVKIPGTDGYTSLSSSQYHEIEVLGSAEEGLSFDGNSLKWIGPEKKAHEFLSGIHRLSRGAVSRGTGSRSRSACYLKSTLTLKGTAQCSKFYFKGDIFNHFAMYTYKDKAWFMNEEIYSKAGIMLEDCTLFVDGDMELAEAPGMGTFAPAVPGGVPQNCSSLSGTNATLIVTGNLKLVGGSLNSGDKGMVIHAKNMDVSTRGNYKGMLLTQGILAINPYPATAVPGEDSSDNRLNVQGALACLGKVVKGDGTDDFSEATDLSSHLEGLVLRSVNLTYDPKYTKAFHRFGQPRIALWREL